MAKLKMRTLDPIPFTKEGYTQVQQEYTELLEKRKSAVDKVKTAREMGDLSENAAYHAARQNLSQIDSRLRFLKMQLVYGKVNDVVADTVGIGCHVTVKDQIADTIKYTIVGRFEANPSSNKISNESPIGQALIGRKVGDRVAITVPKGIITYTIIDIAT